MKISYLIGNGFDRALSVGSVFTLGGKPVDTSYEGLYNCLAFFGYTDYELFYNDLAQNLDYSRWEDLLIERFKKINSDKDAKEYKRQKNQTIEYLQDAFKLWEQRFTPEMIDDRYREFEDATLNFFDRMSTGYQTHLLKILSNRIKDDSDITIEFLTFNGTNILDQLVEMLNKSAKQMTIGGKAYSIKGSIKVLHVHSNINDSDYVSKAFGTTVASDLKSSFISVKDSNLLKTNSLFEKWISDTDVFVVHGLSFGTCDSQYRDWVANRIDNGAVLVDFPWRNPTSNLSKIEADRKALFSAGVSMSSNIIVELNPSYRGGQSGAVIYSFEE